MARIAGQSTRVDLSQSVEHCHGDDESPLCPGFSLKGLGLLACHSEHVGQVRA